MKPFRYCPSCGGGIDEPNEEHGTKCSRCGRMWYRNPAPTVGAALVQDERALVSVRAIEPYAGRIDVPGGFLRAGEGVLDGLRREIHEELGIEIEVGIADCLQIEPHRYGDEGEWTLAIGFRARILSGEPQPADDVADIRWVNEEELDELDWAWEHDRELVQQALKLGR